MHDGRVVSTAVSDDSGAYRVPGLIAQEYVLRVRRIGYNVRGIDVLVSGDTTRDITMDRNRVTLRGVVREAAPCSGAAIQSAVVQIVDGPDAGRSSTTEPRLRRRDFDRHTVRRSAAGFPADTSQRAASRHGVRCHVRGHDLPRWRDRASRLWIAGRTVRDDGRER